MNSISSFSIALGFQLESLAKQIENEPKRSYKAKEELGYLEALRAIYTITQPFFNRLAALAEKAGFGKVEAFEAWPKGLCENFIFGVVESGKIKDVVLATNNKHKFLQNGGGKTGASESSEQAAFREAQEEFGFSGKIEQMKKITIESESGMPEFHFVKGVNIALITPQEAINLKLGDDMARNELTSLPIDEFLRVTDEDTKPIDHGFDRKWIAKYIRAFNSNDEKALQNLQLYQRLITEEDQVIASKAFEWMKGVRVNISDIDRLKDLIQKFDSTKFEEQTKAEGAWKSPENRELVKKAAQKVVDAIVKKLFPDWKYMSKKGEETACQVKVQEAVGILVNGDPLPSFLTIPQMISLQCGLAKGCKFEIAALSQNGESRDITTEPAKALSKYL
jgi:8-oxo-dGTP pyrophosphatase MutT (NUDIX family)